MLRRQARRLGLPGALGAGLLVCGAVFHLTVALPAQARLDALRQSAISRQVQIRESDMLVKDGPAEQLLRFHQAFPADSSLPDWLDRMFAVAGNQGIGLEQGDYKLARDSAGKLLRFQVALPVRGSYPAIRKFISALQTEIPAMALEQVQFERQKVADGNIEAKIKLVLYMEPSA